MNILLAYPKYPDTFWSFKYALKFVAKKAAFPPLGLLTVAAMLPRGWKRRLVDLNVTALKDADIAWADMVFVSAMLVQQESTRKIIARCNAMGTTVVAGGPAFTSQPELFEGVDHFVLNDAETTLPRFLADFAAGTLQHTYASSAHPGITSSPVPEWSLLNFKDYQTMPVQYSRGCPFNCEFCDIIVMNGRVPHAKTPEQLLAEIQALYDAGWRGSIFIVDDNFIGNKKSVKIMLAHLIAWQQAHDYPFILLTEASINLAEDGELMALMSKANFYKVFLGIETPDLESLRECDKIQNTAFDMTAAVQTIQRHGMQVMAGFIVGFDNDRESIFDAQIRFIQKSGVVTAMVGLLSALPRTRLWDRLKTEGRILNNASGENTDGYMNFMPRMDMDKLLQGYRQIISTIYSRKFYYKRINTFLQSYRPTVRTKLTKDDVRAFIRSIWRIGIFSRSRFRYWGLILKTSLLRRKSFPIAVELAIMGMHFEKLSRGLIAHHRKMAL